MLATPSNEAPNPSTERTSRASRAPPLMSNVRPMNKNPVTLCVRTWGAPLTTDVAHMRHSLVSLLREALNVPNAEAKRMARALIAGQEKQIILQDSTLAEAIRNRLEALGAEVELAPLPTT
jgi:hypothetical protein